MTITDLITRDERLGFSIEEQRFLIGEYVMERRGIRLTVCGPRDPRGAIGMAMLPDYVSDLNKLFNHALLWYQINYKHN